MNFLNHINLLVTLLLWRTLNANFLKFPFGNTFKISSREIIKHIPYHLVPNEKKVIDKINGFYGLIGPDVNITEIGSLYDLFTGDGMIQGLFLNNGNLTFVKQFVKTEKILYEESNGRIPKNPIMQFFFMLLNKLGVFPNTMGMANTALLYLHNYVYALFERDVPYQLTIDFDNSLINTIKKINIPKIPHFSGHSKYNGSVIETIDYNIIAKRVSYYQLNENFEYINHYHIPTRYIPIIHDFYTDSEKALIIDSPLMINFENLFLQKIPILFNKNQQTLVHVLNKRNGIIDKYYIENGIYIFHYAKVRETENYIEIYGSLYDNLNFEKTDIFGNYRKIVLDKRSKIGKIEANIETDYYNLDFPISIDENRVVLRSIKDNKIEGFLVLDGLRIIKKIIYNELFICGEPAITKIDGVPYLLCMAFDKNQSHFVVINMNTYDEINIPLPVNLSIGFHSLYIDRYTT